MKMVKAFTVMDESKNKATKMVEKMCETKEG